MKKRIASFIVFIFLANILHSQAIPTLRKLYDISAKLGVTCMATPDTIRSLTSQADLNYSLSEREKSLLRAAEFYLQKDFGSALLYSKKSRINFRNVDLANLSFVLLIGSYSYLKEIKLTAKYLYIAIRKKQMYSENMELIRASIRSNFSRHDFDDALSTFFYYHDRQRILQEIYRE